jgi:NADH-quinone oxidoreductase subunit A
MESGGQAALWPLAVHIALAVLIAFGMLWVSHFLGEKRRDGQPTEPYECGFRPVAKIPSATIVQYFRLAVFFVIFDLEIVFVITWALVVKEVGWPGYGAILVFVLLLLIALVYLWRQGALDWGSRGSTQENVES